MKRATQQQRPLVVAFLVIMAMCSAVADAQDSAEQAASQKNASTKLAVDLPDDFQTVRIRMEAAKPAIHQRHLDLLKQRYDLGDYPAPGVTMARQKPVSKAVQERVRVRLAAGQTWEKLATMAPGDIQEQEQRAAYFDGLLLWLLVKRDINS